MSDKVQKNPVLGESGMNDKKLSILHFSTADNEGGSGRAAYRVHSGLRDLGHQSRMLVRLKVTRDPDVDSVHGGRIGKLSDRLVEEATRRIGLQYQFVPSSRRVQRHPWLSEADVIQLYNIHGGYFSPRMLPMLSRHAPIVWRLSDMWPFTGHCAYSGACDRWLKGCGKCPDLASYPSIGLDLSAWLWRQKRKLYRRSDITIVAPSSWTDSIARQSPLLDGVKIRRIPNGIDTTVFRPRPQAMARTFLNLNPSVKTILFAAQELDNNPRKGSSYLIEALHRLPDLSKTELLLVGVGGETWEKKVPLPVRRLGYITDDRLMSAIYCSADLVVAPSVVDNLPNTVLEAMACGVPAVAFNTGGMSDAVQHMATGYLAAYSDVDGLTMGIGALLNDDNLRLRLGQASVELIRSVFSKQTQAQAFSGLYDEILEARRKAKIANS